MVQCAFMCSFNFRRCILMMLLDYAVEMVTVRKMIKIWMLMLPSRLMKLPMH